MSTDETTGGMGTRSRPHIIGEELGTSDPRLHQSPPTARWSLGPIGPIGPLDSLCPLDSLDRDDAEEPITTRGGKTAGPSEKGEVGEELAGPVVPTTERPS